MSKEKYLHVTARPKNGFRRAGHMFLATAVTVLAASELSPEEYEAIKNEPNLVVVESDGELAAPIDTSAFDQKIADANNKIKKLEKKQKDDADKIAELEKELKAKDAELKKVVEDNGKKDAKAKK